MYLLLVVSSFCIYQSQATADSAPLVVKFAKTGYPDHVQREQYFEDLIVLAMHKSGRAFKLEPVNINPLNEKRSIAHVQANNYTVHWLNANEEVEKQLRPIRIPLYKGLIGWRISFIRSNDAFRFTHESSLQTLKIYEVLQGPDWPDTLVFRENGFKVNTAHYDTLPKMLVRSRGDLYPRSIIEITHEMKVNKEPGMAIEKNLVFRYPAAYYFFVKNTNTELHSALENGLNLSINDGSFDALFLKYFQASILAANLDKRKIIDLDNPFMSKHTPYTRKALWFSADMLEQSSSITK